MANAEVHWEYLEKNLDRVLAFANNFGNAYAMASAQVRRNLNQSMSEEIAVEVDGSIAHAPMQAGLLENAARFFAELMRYLAYLWSARGSKPIMNETFGLAWTYCYSLASAASARHE